MPFPDSIPTVTLDRPNVVVFFTDQQRHDTTGTHGCPLNLTPNFDRLAAIGTDVHRFFTANPVCGPARACLQTGQFASNNGVFRNGIGIPRDSPALGQCFHDAGYATQYIGKWHLGHGGEAGPVEEQDRGGWRGWLGANAIEMTSDAYQTRLWDEGDNPVDLPGYRVDALTDAGIRFMDQHRRANPQQPFCLFTSYLEPHHQNHVDAYPGPLGTRLNQSGAWVPPDLAALPSYNEAEPGVRHTGGTANQQLPGYYAMVQRLDQALGRVVDTLVSMGELENTIIVFLSDHACHFKTRNGEYKRSCHESSIRVPCFIHGSAFTGGGRLQQLVSLVDIPPTLLDACGIDVPDTMDGRSILPLVERDPDAIEAWPDDAYIQVSDGHFGRAIRTARWKYAVETLDPAEKTASHTDLREAYLYDLLHDPYELTNLLGLQSHAKVATVMRQRLARWQQAIGEPVATIHEHPFDQRSGQRTVTDAEAHA
ncbi:MAG: sulfatase-like hydrolase/transferase [Planctomycetota bacterium]